MSDGLVTLRMLGGIELSGPDGRSVRALLAQPSRLALLFYLAAADSDQFHRKDTVRALFWPESDGRHARQALNRAIYVLRQALGTGVLETRGDAEVRVAEHLLRCDVVQFEHALAEGHLEAALELYRGELAPGFFVSGLPDFERWLEAERVRLHQRAVTAALQLVDREEAAGRLEIAERWARRAAELSPYDERAAVRRIALLDKIGDRAAALLVFDRLQRRLREELEVDPSPETVGLVDAMRARRPAPRPVSAGDPDRPPVVGAAPITSAGRRGGVLIGAVTIALVGALSVLLLRPRGVALTTTNAVPVTSAAGIEFQPALSPDGKEVAFVAGGHLVVSRAGAAGGRGEFRPADAEPGGQAYPAWSHNGDLLRYWSCTTGCSWREMSRLGGPSRRVELPRAARMTTWSRDGFRAAFVIRDSIFVYSVRDRRTRLLVVEGERRDGLHSLTWSPDGRRIAYVTGNPFWLEGFNVGLSAIRVVDTIGRRVLVAGGGLNVSPAWLDARRLLFVSDRDGQREIYVVEVGTSGPIGNPQKVPGGTDAHSISVSADGSRLVLAKFQVHQHVWGYPLAGARAVSIRDGRSVTTGNQVVEAHDVSRDGQWLSYDSNLGAGSGGQAQIYKRLIEGGTPMLLAPRGASPRWSPDGSEIAFQDGGNWVMPAEGGVPTRVTETIGSKYDSPALWSPDGLHLAFWSDRSGHLETWLVSRERVGGPWSAPVQITRFGCAASDWAPDGTGVLCRDEPGEDSVALVSVTGTVLWRRDMAAVGLRGMPVFSPDGMTLYVGSRNDSGIWAWPVRGGRAPRLRVAFDDPGLRASIWPGALNATRDRLYVTITQAESDIWVMDLVRR